MPPPHVSDSFLAMIRACSHAAPDHLTLPTSPDPTPLWLKVNEGGSWSLGNLNVYAIAISSATRDELAGSTAEHDANGRETARYIRADLAVRILSVSDGAALPGPVPDPPDPED